MLSGNQVDYPDSTAIKVVVEAWEPTIGAVLWVCPRDAKRIYGYPGITLDDWKIKVQIANDSAGSAWHDLIASYPKEQVRKEPISRFSELTTPRVPLIIEVRSSRPYFW